MTMPLCGLRIELSGLRSWTREATRGHSPTTISQYEHAVAGECICHVWPEFAGSGRSPTSLCPSQPPWPHHGMVQSSAHAKSTLRLVRLGGIPTFAKSLVLR
jgi:hypothetical protein